MTGTVRVFDDIHAMSEAATAQFVRLAEQAIRQRGSFHLALSGGSTPRSLYQCLVQPAHSNQVDWQHVHVYFGDERCVPPDHEDSNYRMASQALLSHVPIPMQNIHRIQGENDSALTGAEHYRETLSQYLPHGNDLPEFDLILLGMGDDGHTASLFPGTAAIEESEQTVAAVYVDKLDAWRISLTFPIINQARHVLFLIAGAGKAETLSKVFDPETRTDFPVQHIRPAGELEWYLDEAAAGSLPAGQRS